MKQGKWIWYPGDFEIYHSLLQNCSREERGFTWPAYWKLDDCRKNINFRKDCLLDTDTEFTVYSYKLGYILVDDKKYPCNTPIQVTSGKHRIVVHTGCTEGLPTILVEGSIIFSDESWLVDDYVSKAVPVAFSSRYNKKEQNPEIWEYDESTFLPQKVKSVNGGSLYDFGEELTAIINYNTVDEFKPFHIYYGESEAEALDMEWSYYSQYICNSSALTPRRAFRYLFIPEKQPVEIELKAIHQYVDFPTIGSFSCEDEKINQIWRTAEKTFKLCSGIFFVDGIKRDKWIWSGDAYQSYFINQYLMFDEEINKRTILALRGNDSITQHINTIVDYSMFWIISIYNHYMATGDVEFIKQIYPKMLTMIEFLEKQTDEHGFIIGREKDWIFIDWADIDKVGAVCAEQLLYAECFKTMVCCSKVLGKNFLDFEIKYKKLISNINLFFWNEDKGAYIDSFQSGKNNVTRHANILSVLFNIADQRQTESIIKNVIKNKGIAPITTPYFKFYELEILCRAGMYDEVLTIFHNYWGGMLDHGAVTFWEEYDPKKPLKEQYEMYGDPYGKSMCHAWAGSPIYLIGRYFMGVHPTEPGYSSYEIKPVLESFKQVSCDIPIKDGKISINWENNVLTVFTNKPGGYLILDGEKIPMEINKNIEYRVA